MKKLICCVLASLMLISATACGRITVDTPTVSTTSSDAEKYGIWLADRLGHVPENVVLGIGDDDSCGIDLSNFEDDGYIIRTVDEKTIVFGKTADGLDRGVRKYALATERGEDVSLITYHEGYRIENFKIFGVDISEYVIEYGTTPNANMEFAASELVQLVKKACGAELTVSETATDAAHKIILRHSEDEELRLDGFRYFAEGANLVIEGAVDRGCMYGVYYFLQNECGWDNLANMANNNSGIQTVGDSCLAESDLVDVPADVNRTQVPMLDFYQIYKNSWRPLAGVTDRTTPTFEQWSYGTVEHASHGMQTRMWDGEEHTIYHSQACYTEEDNLEFILDNIIEYIDGQIDAGMVPGKSLKMIDISQGDNNRYCYCVDCCEIMIKYKSVSSSVVYGANYVAEKINALYPSEEGIAVQIFAYFASKIPPVNMEINENVYITFAQNGNCTNHYMDGSECKNIDGSSSDDFLVNDNNILHDQWLRGWCELSDNVYVWYYALALELDLHQYTVLDTLYQDFQYMKEIGVKGLFFQNESWGFGIKRVEHRLALELMWNPDMTEEEYEERLCHILSTEYGEGYEYVREYIDLWVESTNIIGCFNCWGYGNNANNYSDPAYLRQNGDVMIDLMEKALSLAADEKQEYRINLLMCHVYYCYIFANYFPAYEAEDSVKLAELEQMYNDTIELILDLGFELEGKQYNHIYPTLEQEAWIVWVSKRTAILGYSENLRPAPEVEDIYAETEVA